MDKETLIKKLTLILEDFDSNRKVEMKYFLDSIYSVSEMYFAEVIKEEREMAIKEFLVKQLKRRGL